MSAEKPYDAFTVLSSAKTFELSQKAYITQHPDPRYSYVATGALVVDKREPSAPRILLLQRAASDSMPGCWEIPGGACDDTDKSILHATARELWEEAGLRATLIGPEVGEAHFFSTRSGKDICKFNFLVEVHTNSLAAPEVTLDPSEHQQYVWATEHDVESNKAGDIGLKFTTRDVQRTVLDTFLHLRTDLNPKE